MSKLHSYQSLAAWTSAQRTSGYSIGFACGAFDLVHAGHVAYLEKAASLCDRLIVGVNSDESIRAYKDPLRPIIAEQQRAVVVAALSAVDAVTVMTETRPANLIELIRPDVYVKGGDYQVEQLKSGPLVHSYGGRCVVIPVEHAISTSAIVKRIGDLAAYDTAALTVPQKPAGRVVFLDRDGTLIENIPFLREAGKVQLLPYVGEGLRSLQDEGYSLVVVTNQQGIGLGYFDYDDFVRVNAEMLRLLSAFGVRISRFYFCPHSVADDCRCRKPLPDLLERGLRYFEAEPESCFFVGDSDSDMVAAEAAGCHGIFVSKPSSDDRDRRATDFRGAVELIVNFVPAAKAS